MVAVMWVVVVPTNRPEKFQEFYNAWESLFFKHRVYLVIVEDAPERSKFQIKLPTTHLCWEDVSDFIPTKTDMIRSWGFYYAWKNNLGKYILTLDDDTVPINDPFEAYLDGFQGSVYSKYLSVGALTDSGLEMRGFPYKDRVKTEVAVQYGGWAGVLDYDAATQLAVPQPSRSFQDVVMPVPVGVPTTCCIMNTAFQVSYVPILWQLTMMSGRYNRIGDIWSGLFIKKTLDALGKVMLINGKATVGHQRASDPYKSLVKEAPSVWMNDTIWDNLITPTTTNMLDAYGQVTESAYGFFRQHDIPYAEQFREDKEKWLNLFR